MNSIKNITILSFLLVLLSPFISAITISDTEITSDGLSTIINITGFSITVDKLVVTDNSIAFHGLSYTNPLGGLTTITLLNYTESNKDLTISDFPYIESTSSNVKSVHNELGVTVVASMSLSVENCNILNINYGGTSYGSNQLTCSLTSGIFTISVLSTRNMQINYNTGGGGGGGTEPDPVPDCNSLWLCDEWSFCSNDLRSRSCSDINSCNSNEPPPLLLSCSEPVGQRVFGCTNFKELDIVITRWKYNLLGFDLLNEIINRWKGRLGC